jgi:hypothetical protein
MKLIEHEVERTGEKVRLKASFRDRFRQPATVSVRAERAESPTMRVVHEGDAKEVFDTMAAFAEIAWGMGWRPAGLGPTLAAVVDRFKLPKPE